MRLNINAKLLGIILFVISQQSLAAQCNINIRGEWGTGFTVDITISNDTNEDINGWSVGLDFADGSSINNMWNANLSGTTPSYTATNVGYNGQIKSGQSRSFGFNAKKAVSGQPAIPPSLSGVCEVDSEPPDDPEDPPTEVFLACNYALVNEWGSGFTANVTLNNNGEKEVNGWEITLEYPDNTTISGAWRAKLSNGPPLVFSNANYNGRIGAGESVSFGFNANKAQQGQSTSTPLLGGMCIESDTPPANEAPTATISANTLQISEGEAIELDGSQSIDPEGEILSFAWDFGDGSTSTAVNVSKVYPSAGEYTVSLVVNDGEYDSQTAQVVVDVIEESSPPDEQSYILDNSQSSLYFVSTKKSHVIETHEFTQLSGSINGQGEAELIINLNSVSTGVETRDQRMRDYLFEVDQFANAELNLVVNPDEYDDLAIGQSVSLSISPTLTIKGISVNLQVDVTVTQLAGNSLLVKNTSPVIIDAVDFNLEQGIETLRELANLSSISHAIPSNFTLVFTVN